MATVKAWAAAGVAPRDCGLGAVKVIGKVLDRAGLKPSDVTLWEINEAFASVPDRGVPRVRASTRSWSTSPEVVAASAIPSRHPVRAW